MKIYLASKSPRRKQLLEEAGVEFTVRTPLVPVDETLEPEEWNDPFTAAKKLAERKAGALVQELLAEPAGDTCVIIGADTIVVKDGEVFGKPKNLSDAKHMLRTLSGATHQVMTGVSVWMILPSQDDPEKVSIGMRSFTDESQVTFRSLTDEEIADYLRKGESFDKAGAYAIQGEGASLVRCVQGAMDTVIGLSAKRLLREFPELVGLEPEED